MTLLERVKKVKVRVSEARRLLKKPHRQLVVWKTGGVPAAAFGTEVFGVNANVLKWMRGSAARMSPGGGTGVLVAAVLALHPENDPGRKVLLGPIVRYAEEVWVCSDPGLWHERHLKTGDLLGGMQRIAKTCRRTATAAVVRRGPLSAMINSLDLVGWTFVKPTLFLDQNGEEIDLTAGEPKLLQKSLRQQFSLSKKMKQLNLS